MWGNKNISLINASRECDIEKVKRLIEKGADVGAKSNNGMTATIMAAWNGQKGVVWLLIEKGADVEAKDNNGWTAMMRAAVNGNKDVVELLITKGADVGVKDNNDETAMMWAAWNGQKGVVWLLIEKGADVEAKDNRGKDAADIAEERGDHDTAKLIRDHQSMLRGLREEDTTVERLKALGRRNGFGSLKRKYVLLAMPEKSKEKV